MNRLIRAASPVLLAALALVPLAVVRDAAAQPTNWEPRGPGGGGALFQPSLSPHAVGEMHVSCDMSQLFRTDDFGRSWSMLDFRVLGGNTETRVWYTEDPNVVYTIDRANRALVELHQPVRSLDGGRTWQPLPGLDPWFDAGDMAVDPQDGSRVFVVDYGELFGSQDGGQTFGAALFTDSTGGGVRIAGIFTDRNLVLLGTNSGLLVSVDGGLNFDLNPPGMSGIDFDAEGMTGFAGAKDPATSAIRLVCVTHSLFDIYLSMYGCEDDGFASVYTLDWPSMTWTQRINGLLPAGQPFFAGMTQDDIDVMWLAGGNDAFSTPYVARTTDGGLNWTTSLICPGNDNVATGWSGDGGDRGWSYGECAMGFGVSPVDPLRAAISDYGFVHVTDDGGASWRQAYVDPTTENPPGARTPTRRSYRSVGLENTTAWNIHWVDANILIGCHSDIRGARSEDGGLTWGFDYSGHASNSMYSVVQRPSDGRLFAAVSSVHDLYQSTRLADNILNPGQGSVLFSDDSGDTWQVMRNFGEIVAWVALHPSQPDTLYASVVDSVNGDVFVTRNASLGATATWSRLASPPRTEGHPFNIRVLDDGTLVASYSGRRDGLGAFTASSGVFVSLDDGASWLDRSDPGMRFWTKDIVIDPHDPGQQVFYACVYSGWGGAARGTGGLYRSPDRGLNWTRILDVDRVGSITISPTDPEEAYVTTEADGLWFTSDLRSATPSFAQDPNYPFRQPERVLYNPHVPGEIWVTSFGNGLRVGQDGVVPPSPSLRRVTLATRAFDAPPLGTLLPMDAADIIVPDVMPGDVDPDPTIVGDPARPVAYYDIDSDVLLRVSLDAARRLRVDYSAN